MAYRLLSHDPTYMVPSTPIAGEEKTSPLAWKLQLSSGVWGPVNGLLPVRWRSCPNMGQTESATCWGGEATAKESPELNANARRTATINSKRFLALNAARAYLKIGTILIFTTGCGAVGKTVR
jgi:hypothetical protein